VELARRLVHAAYGALAWEESDGTIPEFYTVGLSRAQRAALGPLPQGRGLLGELFVLLRSSAGAVAGLLRGLAQGVGGLRVGLLQLLGDARAVDLLGDVHQRVRRGAGLGGSEVHILLVLRQHGLRLRGLQGLRGIVGQRVRFQGACGLGELLCLVLQQRHRLLSLAGRRVAIAGLPGLVLGANLGYMEDVYGRVTAAFETGLKQEGLSEAAIGPRQAIALPGSIKWPIDSTGTPQRVGIGISCFSRASGRWPSLPSRRGWLGP